jgi:hypothetical protein
VQAERNKEGEQAMEASLYRWKEMRVECTMIERLHSQGPSGRRVARCCSILFLPNSATLQASNALR